MGKFNDFLIHILFLIMIAGLVGGFLYVLNELRQVKQIRPVNSKETIIEKVIQNDVPPKIIQTSSIPKPSKKISYINLIGSLTTTNTDWVDIPGTDLLLNQADYGENSYIDWEASVLVSSLGNKVYVRLYDTTNKIAVNGSELFSEASTGTRVSSGRLYMWRGQNNYRVQIKSLNGQSVTFNSGKIKIVY